MKINKSVRIPRNLQGRIRRTIVRLTLHPVLYYRSESVVGWTSSSLGHTPPQQIIIEAIRSYPKLTLSSAVEAVLLDRIQDHISGMMLLTEDETKELNRFMALPLAEKIRITRQRMSTYRYLMQH